MTIKLSFCIPVYNFGDYVGQALDSIFCDVDKFSDFEVVVLDGGSTDRTPEILREYTLRYSQIRYIRQEHRGGIDADLHRCVEEARGEYCWLLSGDDTIREGGIQALCRFIDNKSDVYLCEHTQCDIGLNFLYDYPIFLDRRPRIVNMSHSHSRELYMARSLNTEACFSFMSGLIVRRDVWLSAEPPVMFKGSCWWHVARLFEHLKQGLNVCYVGETWVNRRGDNDSFLDQGLVRRLGIAIEGYHRLANYYFGADSIEAIHIRRLVRADVKFVLFMHAKLLTREKSATESRKDLDRLVRRAYCDNTFSCFAAKCVYFCTPIAVYKVVRGFWRLSRTLARELKSFGHGRHEHA